MRDMPKTVPLAGTALGLLLAGPLLSEAAAAPGQVKRVPDRRPQAAGVDDVPPVPADEGVTQPEPDTPLDQQQLQRLPVRGIEPTQDGAKVDLGEYTGYVRVLTPDLVNVAVVKAGEPVPESPGILKHDWPSVPLRHQDTGGRYVIRTSSLTVEISKEPFGVVMRDRSGRIVNEDDLSRGSGYENGKPYVFKRAQPDERFYGFGEQTRRLNKRGDSIGMWNTDAYSYTKNTKYLYTSIPFFVGLRDGRAHGVMFDNTYRSYFEMASQSEDSYHFYANGGPLSYYVFNGPKVADVITRYTELTGRMKQPPQWALGWHQSKWGYKPQSQIVDIARTYREKGIPLDTMHLDIDYMDGYRVFTWGEQFSDPAGLNRELDALGVRSVTINDPAVKKDPGYSVYDEGEAGGYWAKNPDGTDFVGKVWPEDSKFPDFARQDVRDWWAGKHDVLFANGVDGLWLDMNEPAVFDGPHHTMPLDTRFDGGKLDHREFHNLYGFRETEATADAFRRYKPNERPFILTRDMFAGSQRWAALWTGDNVSNWDHLKMSIPMNLNVGLSGVPFVGNDIGGFASRPGPELMARWLEVGALLPFARIHYDSDEKAPVKQGQEPWAYGPEVEEIGRRYIRLRYALLPYLQNAFRTASDTGAPVWQPLLYQFQDDPETYEIDDEYMVGERLLVAPVVDQGQTARRVYLPEGATWTDYWTGERHRGGTWVDRPADLGTLPIYVRGESIIPSREVQQHTGEKPLTDLVLDGWVDKRGSTTFYEDDGATLDYERGAYDATTFTITRRGRGVRFSAKEVHDGFASSIRTYTLRLHGVERRPSSVAAGAAVPFSYDAGSDVLELEVPVDRAGNVEVRP
jgi:alpha-glucosidase